MNSRLKRVVFKSNSKSRLKKGVFMSNGFSLKYGFR